MTRHPDWEERLHAYAGQKHGKGFRWGSTDCASLVKGAVTSMYPGTPLGDVPAYRRREAAEEALASVGGVATCLETAGASRVVLGLVQAGDVLILPGHDGSGLPRLGVVLNGSKYLTSLPGHGAYIARLHMAVGAEAWRMP